MDVYADYPDWPRLFPTISAARVLGRHGPKLVLESTMSKARSSTSS